MATNNKTSALVQSQLPQYLVEDGPNLIAFMKAYYEWMETTNQATDASRNLLNYQDIDTTDLEKFYEYFKKEVLCDFPKVILADQRLVAKRIKDLYRSKGSSAAYNLLFRILFDEDISVVRPSESILRASDGRWQQDTVLRLGQPFSGNLDNAIDKVVTGQNSGAKGKVTRVLSVFENGIAVTQFRLVEVSGTFFDLEQVLTSDGIGGYVVNTIGPLTDVTFGTASTTGGTGHQVGDFVNLTSTTGSQATGRIDATTNQAVDFNILSGGSGYTVGDTVITITGGNVKGGLVGEATVASISNTETLFGYTDTIENLKQTPIGYGPTYSSNSGVISSNLASSNSSTALGTALGTFSITAGKIASITTTLGNYDVTLPAVFATDTIVSPLDLPDGFGGFKGRNALLTASFQPGSITDITVLNGGTSYNAIDAVTVVNTSRGGTNNGIGDPVISGVVTLPGAYKGTKGQLSSDMRLQDNYYYQQFSYDINSSTALKTYRDIVHDVIHPAGTKLFGTVNIGKTIDASGVTVESALTSDLVGGKQGLPSIAANTTFGNIVIELAAIVPSITSNTIVAPALTVQNQFVTANGTIYVANNNVVNNFLTFAITSYLPEPVMFGTAFNVQGDGNATFGTFLQGGSFIEIEDKQLGSAVGNTTYIVNTVFSNTSFTMNTPFVGGATSNGILRYTRVI